MISQPEVDLHYVKEHMVECMALANKQGQTVSSHFRWVTFSLPLNMGPDSICL